MNKQLIQDVIKAGNKAIDSFIIYLNKSIFITLI